MRLSAAFNVMLVALLAAGAALYGSEVKVIALQTEHRIVPCASPITYTLTSIDPRFHVSTSTVERALSQAAGIWNQAGNGALLTEAPDGLVKIRLVYDTRQATSQQLSQAGFHVGDQMAAYDAARAQYEHDAAGYAAAKERFELAYAQYQSDAAAYERDVSRWNARGGAPPDAYAQLQARKQALDQEGSHVRALEGEVNAAADTVNGEADHLNSMAKELNLNVAAYNKVGASLSQEYQEAVFESAPGAESIEVYEFDSTARLRRVLTHELGHALGLDHVEGAKSIMYAVNQSTNETPTVQDLAELARVCRE